MNETKLGSKGTDHDGLCRVRVSCEVSRSRKMRSRQLPSLSDSCFCHYFNVCVNFLDHCPSQIMRLERLTRPLQTAKSLSSYRALLPSLAAKHARIAPQVVSRRSVGTKPLYEGHIPLNWFEHTFLTVGSALRAVTDPRRGGKLLYS